jgi:hypothetical protein
MGWISRVCFIQIVKIEVMPISGAAFVIESHTLWDFDFGLVSESISFH